MTRSTASTDPAAGVFAGARRRFRIWRLTRPFWAGLLTLTAAFPIMYFPYAHLSFGGLTVAISTTAGAASLTIGTLLIVLALMMWFQPQVRIFAGAATILLTLISFPLSDLGGFFLGLIPGLVGGSLACSWAPLVTTAGRAAPAGEPQAPSDAPEQVSLRS